MSLEYSYAQHLLFQTCSSLIWLYKNYPKLSSMGDLNLSPEMDEICMLMKKQTQRDKCAQPRRSRTRKFTLLVWPWRLVSVAMIPRGCPSQRELRSRDSCPGLCVERKPVGILLVAASQAEVWFQLFQKFIWKYRRDLLVKTFIYTPASAFLVSEIMSLVFLTFWEVEKRKDLGEGCARMLPLPFLSRTCVLRYHFNAHDVGDWQACL